MPETTSESKSSVKVTLNAKGEAQLEVKVYEGEEFLIPGPTIKTPEGSRKVDGKVGTTTGDGIAEVITARLMHVIRSLEHQRIKVVGRELPDKVDISTAGQQAMREATGPTQVDPDIGKDARHS